MEKLVVASSNKGKLKEIKALLGDKYQIISMQEAGFIGDVEEDGQTFFDNALIKAKAVSETLGVDALADDSGLCVEVLGGRPGVYSARFSGVHGDDKANRKLLLEKLQGVTDRRAKFVSSVVLYKKNGEVLSGLGETCGQIAYEEEGQNGFGYDSLFVSDDLGVSFGVCSDEQKNSVSHRYRALCDLLKKL